MIRVLGGPKRLCDGLTRRDLLHVGSLGLLGLGLPGGESERSAGAGTVGPATSASALPGFGRAKACILLFLYGSPSQLETFDPKPGAPAEVRGELGDNGQPVALDLGEVTMPGDEAESGRGLALALASLDHLTHERVDGRNRWTLVCERVDS